ncbi:FadR/GntR family transcriptional regulator [Terriglobus sp. ADX1]|uniref:FadR/GntR family transcriptional regulator n=1 Tax=Terriglobus sp. ADX1 TaxID=2794063 RepID=UPI002FE52636
MAQDSVVNGFLGDFRRQVGRTYTIGRRKRFRMICWEDTYLLGHTSYGVAYLQTMAAERIPVNTLASRVTDFVFEYIRENGLSTGDSLPSELKTSTELKVSRGVVREAFHSLEVAGIIEKGNGRSPKVGTLDSGFLTQLLLHAVSTQQISTEQVMDVRTAVEVRSAELAALRRSRADIQQLRAAITGMKQSLENASDFVEHDVSFHSIINRATGNLLVDVIGCAMHGCMRQSMRSGILQRRKKTEMIEVVQAHVRIADAIENREPAKAGIWMKRHFADARRALRRAQVV